MTKKRLTTYCSASKVVLLCVVGLFLLVSEVLGATIFEDNFDTYNLGNLVGQGGWILDEAGQNSPQVIDTIYYSEPNSVEFVDTVMGQVVKKFGNAVPTGQISFFIKYISASGDIYSNGLIRLLQGTSGAVLQITIKCTNLRCDTYGANLVLNDTENFCFGIRDEWEQVIVEWDSETDKVRARCDNEYWTNWVNPYDISDISYTDSFWIGNAYFSQNFKFYIDSISTPTEIVERIPYEMYEEDICEGLGTIEKWLCEIKNLFKGIFIPSQQKVSELKENIELVKQKFPLNYLSSASDFFSDVKTNINSSSDIDFKILGKAGTVDFAFWKKETEIGGSIQKIGEIFRVFITFLIVVGFVFWAISFGKRIF
jgi:hypothetical protein